MAFDISALLQSAVAAGAAAVQQAAPQAEDFLREMTKAHEKALTHLGEAFARGDIDEDTLKSELDDQAKILETELLVVAMLAKAVAQRAINAFRDALFDGLKAAVAAVL